MKKFFKYTIFVVMLLAVVWLALPPSVQARVDKLFEEFCVFKGGVSVVPRSAALSNDDGYYYLMEINDYGTSGTSTDTGQGKIVGGAAKKGYALGIDVTIPSSGTAFSGDSNTAALKGTIRNYKANDSNFIMRGIDILPTNRLGGEVGILTNNIGIANRGIAPTAQGLRVHVENYGTTATELGGIDIELSNEGAAATTEYGLRIRNTNNSLATAVDNAIQITDTGTNTGYTNGIAIGTSIVQSQITFSNGAKLFVGSANGENAVYAEVGAYDAVGSIYISSVGKIYVQVADNGANADWETVTSASVE